MGKYCICFCRVSTQQQDLVQQTQSIISEANRMGYDTDHQIIIEYKESGISLSSNERVGIDKLKELINNNSNIDCVICWELSRIGRRADVIYDIRDFFLKHNIQWIVMNPYMRLLENNGKTSQTSSIMLALFTSLAESEMEIKKERFARGKERSRELGKHIGGQTPFGYYVDKDKYLKIEEKSAKIVKQIYDMYSTGRYSISSLSEELSEFGYFDNFSNKLSLQSFIYYVLKNEKYCGNKHRPAIISEELFYKVQQILHENKLILKPSNKGNILCKRLLYNTDGYCLIPQVQKHKHKEGTYVIYTNGPNKGPSVYISDKSIDSLVWECSKYFHKKYLNNENTIKKKQVELCEALTKKYNVAKEKCIKIQEKIDRSEERYIYGKISKAKNDEITYKLQQELNEWKMKESLFVDEIRQRIIQIKEVMTTNEEDLEKYTLEQKCSLIRTVIERVVIQRETNRRIFIIKIYSKMDNRIYMYKIWVSNGRSHKWELLNKSETWTIEDFIKPNRQGKQTPIIIDPQRTTTNYIKT